MIPEPERHHARYFYIKTPGGEVLTTSDNDEPVMAEPWQLSCRWNSNGFIFHFLGDYLVNDKGGHLRFEVPDDCGPGFEEYEGDTFLPGDLGE